MSGQTRSAMRALLERHGLRPRKHLGQHFLADPNIVRKIVTTAGVTEGSRVLEVGAGTGALTLGLVEAGGSVQAYEIDPLLEPVLREVLAGTGVDLRIDDIMSVDLNGALGAGSWMLVANLPYSVGTPLLLDILRHVPAVASATVMVQREVADRLCAKPRSSDYGLPSVVVGLTAEARLAFTVAPQVFVPAPRVESAVVRIDRIEAHPLTEQALRLAGAAFSQRRKMVRRSLRSVLADPAEVLERAGVHAESRAEDLAPEAYLQMAEACHV